MMIRTSLSMVPVALVFFGSVALATGEADRVQHFEGLPSETLAEAVTNFSTYNTKLQAVLDQDTLDGQAVSTVHELTYTLEIALAKINAELAELAETLEALHVASETADLEAISRTGRAYLSVAREVIP
ncbi:DUF6746 family protein [Thiocapsa imhoffii]|nr:DUF6746 family protein [Thiocapsa imhoffii]